MQRIYKAVYQDVYEFHKKYGRVPPDERDEEYWLKLAEEMEAFTETNSDKFTVALLLAVVEELDRECREAGGHERR